MTTFGVFFSTRRSRGAMFSTFEWKDRQMPLMPPDKFDFRYYKKWRMCHGKPWSVTTAIFTFLGKRVRDLLCVTQWEGEREKESKNWIKNQLSGPSGPLGAQWIKIVVFFGPNWFVDLRNWFSVLSDQTSYSYIYS